MARFPRTEAEIVALAQDIIGGLTANSATYPAPPTAPLDLQALLDSFVTLSDDSVAARAASEQATATKEAGLEEMTNAMQSVLRYAENTVDFDDDQLKLLGWGRPQGADAAGAAGSASHARSAPTGRRMDLFGLEEAGRRRPGGGLQDRAPRDAGRGLAGSQNGFRERGHPDRPGAGQRVGIPDTGGQQGGR